MDREYQILCALYGIGYPVPCPLIHCPDASVIGTEFYVMEYVRGRVFRDALLPGVPPGERSLMYRSFCNTLALLHSIDWAKIGLSGYGGRSQKSYCQRQASLEVEFIIIFCFRYLCGPITIRWRVSMMGLLVR